MFRCDRLEEEQDNDQIGVDCWEAAGGCNRQRAFNERRCRVGEVVELVEKGCWSVLVTIVGVGLIDQQWIEEGRRKIDEGRESIARIRLWVGLYRGEWREERRSPCRLCQGVCCRGGGQVIIAAINSEGGGPLGHYHRWWYCLGLADFCQLHRHLFQHLLKVPFGKVVRCPSCMIAVSVAQPQHGIQIASCSGCRCQYELVSGNIASIESEEISMDIPAWERGLRFLQVMKQSIPAAVHSIVVQTPTGIARTYRFATKTVELPAQEGERVTVCLAAPSDVYRKVGPFRFISKTPGFNSGEPMCLTNHTDGRESQLLRAPSKNENFSLRNPSVLFPLLALLATGDAASGIIDPSLPQLISVSAVASVALGTTLNMVVLPQLNRLPQRKVDVLAIKQKLLSQYDLLQTRLKDLRQAAEDEVWMLARMCQLENKILAVGEPSYRARRSRIKSVRESLENSLVRRIELIDSYARISSLIEIEVEMDSDVPAAEATSSTENIAEQIEQIMELENLEQRWRMQAEANDEVERLLSTDPVPTEQV